MSELKNGFLTAEEVMDILQVKQSKAYQIIRQLNKELSGMGLITVPGKESRRRNVASRPNGKRLHGNMR